MLDARSSITPRSAECLRLVWEKQATSKEIGLELGIAKTTVDGYISNAVELLGARDRREAARMVWGGTDRAESGPDSAPIAPAAPAVAEVPPSTNGGMPRPWRSPDQRYNRMTLGQTLGSITLIGLGSLMAVALSASIGAGLPAIWRPVLIVIRRLTH